MLLQQAILLSLCLGIRAHHVWGHNYGGGYYGGGGSSIESSAGNGMSDSGASTSSTVASSVSTSEISTVSATATAVNQKGGSPTDTTASAVSQKGGSPTDTTAATSSTAASSSGSGIVAGLGNSTSGTADQSTGGGDGATLLAANIQPASDSDGQADVEAGQSPSATDPDNFINFCSGKNTTDGFQVVTGSCNGVVMGDIPSSSNMISSIITNPAPGDTLQANTDFTVNVQVSNLDAGSFTNPLLTYYAAPQTLNNGIIVGHTHITIQSLGNSLTASTPPDPQKPAFFKGVNDAGNGQGGLSATVTGGLPAGFYRVCTMTSASNHQPVLMPVANRGAQDDCTKFTVSDSGASTAGSGNANTGNNNSAQSATSSVASSSSQSTTTAASSSSTTDASISGSNSTVSTGSSRGGRGGRFARRAFIA